MRIEQLYPFPHKAMQEVLQQFVTSRICLVPGRARDQGAR
ncbi:hypothetical protein ACNKHR_03280 [Shigella flexneri]